MRAPHPTPLPSPGEGERRKGSSFHELDLAEVAVGLVVRTGGEVENVAAARCRVVAEADAPQSVDRDGVIALLQTAGVMPIPGGVLAVRVDPAVAEVSNQEA